VGLWVRGFVDESVVVRFLSVRMWEE
jgi:hypothetical protein